MVPANIGTQGHKTPGKTEMLTGMHKIYLHGLIYRPLDSYQEVKRASISITKSVYKSL